MILTDSILEVFLILTSSLNIIRLFVCHKHDESTPLLTDEEIEAEYALKPFSTGGLHSFSKVIEDRAFVDKTLLIKDFFNFPENYVYLTASMRFGKTINLDMLRTFFDAHTFENGSIQEREQTDSYKMFKKTNIFRKENDFFEEHAQQYKVLRFNFSPLMQVEDIQTFKEQLARVICYAMEDYTYLKNLGSTLDWYPDTRQCVDIEEKKSMASLQNAGLALAKEIFKYHKKKVIVTIDEYDAFLRMIMDDLNMSPDLFARLLTRLSGFVDPMAKMPSQILKGFFVGTLTLGGVISTLANNVRHFYTNSCPKLGSYFGFTQQELNQLLKRFQIRGLTDKVKEYYDGYSVEGLPGVSIYSPFSIISFLTENKFVNSWTVQLAQTALLTNFFSHPRIGDAVERILSGNSYSYTFISDTKPQWNAIQSIRESIMSKNTKTLSDLDEGLVIQFLFESGYFSRDNSKPSVSVGVGKDAFFFKAANLEIKEFITNTLFSSEYLRNKLKLSTNEIVRVGEAINKVLPNDTKSIKVLAEAIYHMFIHVCPISDERTAFHGPLYGALINLGVQKRFGPFTVHTEDKINLQTQKEVDLEAEFATEKEIKAKKAMADLVVIINGIAVVVELERHRTSEYGLRQILRDHRYDVFEQKFPQHKLRSKIYMGVNIAPNGTITISFLCDNIDEKNAKKVQYPEEAKVNKRKGREI